jgi:hypothetical protein
VVNNFYGYTSNIKSTNTWLLETSVPIKDWGLPFW